MITDTLTSHGKAAITSDKWHVVHSHFTSGRKPARPFVRKIVSEHASRSDCKEAARQLRATMSDDSQVALAERDEFLVRPPHFKSLRSARRRKAAPEE